MAEVPPREPRDPAEDETVVADDWGPETIVVDQTEVPPPRRRRPMLWPWLLALLVLVLAGLGTAYALSRDDDDEEAAPPTTATATRDTSAERVVVPDVVGTTSSEATATLREAGFEADLRSVPSDRPAGTVVAQDPAGGSEEPEGATVRLNVAEPAATTTGTTTEATTTAPPEPVVVQDVVGQELAGAARTFAGEGLKVSVRYVPSNEAAGRVVAQAQPAGTERTRGDSVQLNVSTGSDAGEAASVPDVVGRRLDRGRSTLEQAGFEVLALDLEGADVRSEDEIASQSPAAGASIPRGSLVLLYLAA